MMTKPLAHQRLEALFGVIVDKARDDPAFGEALLSALEEGVGVMLEENGPPLRDAMPDTPVIARGRSRAPRKSAGKKTPAQAIAKGRNRPKKRPTPTPKSTLDAGDVLPELLPDLDLNVLIGRQGRRGAQTALLQSRYTAPQLRAYAQERGLDLGECGRRRRDVIDALIAAAPIARVDAFA